MHAIRTLRTYGIFGAVLIAAALSGFSAEAATPAGGWVLLGERQADLKLDRDRIVVGRVEGKFRQIQITVRGAPVEMYDVVVTFGNDQQFKPTTRFIFDERTSSRIIDLPGELRAIKHVDFLYRSASRREGRAVIQLYGR